jgi:hypothetical protein
MAGLGDGAIGDELLNRFLQATGGVHAAPGAQIVKEVASTYDAVLEKEVMERHHRIEVHAGANTGGKPSNSTATTE